MKFLLSLLLVCFCSCNDNKDSSVKAEKDTTIYKAGEVVRPSVSYESFIAACKAQVINLRKQNKPQQLQEVIYQIIAEKMPVYWHGTAWDFNGTTRIAGKESIACGYFITTILEDIGLKISRNKMAQKPSSVLIKATCSNVKNYATIQQLQDYLSNIPSNTILIVGLDFHTGFIIKEKDSIYFFHSNYIGKQGVVKEAIEMSRALNKSKSFMIGILSRNNNYITKAL